MIINNLFELIKNILKKNLSYRQKMSIQLIYNIFKNPKSFNCYINELCFYNKLQKTSKINYTPPVFSATIIDSCNLRCPTCLYLLENKHKFFPSAISPDKFCEILNKYNKDKKAEVIFLTGGEPLMHPNFDELINICREYNLSPKISSNGILIKDNIQSLTKLDYVNVSIDSYNYESFKKYRGGSPKQFDQIMSGLKALKENGVFFSISFLLSTDNIFEIDKMIKLAEDVTPNFVYFHNINPHGCKQYRSLTLQDENTTQFLNKIINKSDYPFNIIISTIFDINSKSFYTEKCIQPWYYFCFNSVGDISYCCHLAHNSNIGNVFNNYTYNSYKMMKFRKNIMIGEISQSCLYCQRRFTNKEYAEFNSTTKKWIIARQLNNINCNKL